MSDPAKCAPPDPFPRTPKNQIPAGATDCHFHVFDGPSQQDAARTYSASNAPLVAYQGVQKALKLDRAVIVQPSIYGVDNRTTLTSFPSKESTRAVVVVNDDVNRETLRDLTNQGAVGARINMLFPSSVDFEDIGAFAKKLADVGWHLQVLADVSKLENLEVQADRLPVPMVFDHMGHVPVKNGIEDPGFQKLLRLLGSGKVWVKLSGSYRIAASDRAAAGPMAKALIAENPENLVWGTDWPHPAISGPMPNDADLLDEFFEWAELETVRKILVSNPERLYGFSKWEAS